MRIKLTNYSPDSNWIEGIVNNGDYCFEAKVYDEDSSRGIQGGRVSKLSIYIGESYSLRNCIVNYDRGWDIEPETTAEENVLFVVLDYLEDI